MLGWARRAEMRASSRNMRCAVLFPSSCGCSILSTTSLTKPCGPRVIARCTTPMPPRPISRRSWYFAERTGVCRLSELWVIGGDTLIVTAVHEKSPFLGRRGASAHGSSRARRLGLSGLVGLLGGRLPGIGVAARSIRRAAAAWDARRVDRCAAEGGGGHRRTEGGRVRRGACRPVARGVGTGGSSRAEGAQLALELIEALGERLDHVAELPRELDAALRRALEDVQAALDAIALAVLRVDRLRDGLEARGHRADGGGHGLAVGLLRLDGGADVVADRAHLRDRERHLVLRPPLRLDGAADAVGRRAH